MAGDDIKTLQENMGHYSAAITLDRYGHVTPTMRRESATLAIQNGVDCKTISHNLGHATVAFTMDVYASVSMTMQKDSVQKMESFIASL